MGDDGEPIGGVLDADALRTFAAVCDTGSFRAAAAVVHRSPAAVSARIAGLEDRLGRPVFDRVGRRVRLNEDGAALLRHARRILSLHTEALAQFARDDLMGTVRFGAPDDYGTRWLPAILRRLIDRHPAVEVEVVLGPSSAVLDAVGRGDLDVGLVTVADDRGAPGEVVHREPLVWVGAASGSAAHAAVVPVALAGATCAWRMAAVAALAEAERRHRIALTCEHSAGQVAAVRADLAVAPLPASMIEADLERVPEGVLPPLPDYAIRLVARPGHGAPATALVECVRHAVGG